ncbi:formate/nitrite transporter family protein [Brachybacterium squillarum]|uniref:formate/nitrite transporter family protein n=1 Tax=Brachybacterium squillarum TaxID=661979 RepID=UPI000262B1FF|nr:formate/nitrite transporter family protein [Brachybacterium squillarum]
MADPSTLFPGKVFISTALEALDTKTQMSGALIRVYLMRAAMAGIIIGTMYLTNYAIIAGFAEVGNGDLARVGAMVGAAVFGAALVLIYYSKSELLTSNMMIVSIGAYYHRTGLGNSLRVLGLCYLGNALGGLLIAVLVRFSTLIDGAVGEQVDLAVEHKLAYIGEGVTGWGDLLVRAIFCNFMINIAMLVVYNGFVKEDLAKCLVMVASVFVFAFLGFEHSVANTVLFLIVGLQGGLDVAAATGNVAIALVGNFIGGGVLIGIYYAYANDDTRAERRRRRRHPARD